MSATAEQTATYFDATFSLPDGTEKTFIVDSADKKFCGLVTINEAVPEWVGQYRATQPTTTPKGAKIRANNRRTGGYMGKDENDQPKTFEVTTTVTVLEAKSVTPTQLYSGIVEHNTWEGESWFYAFPSTPAVNEALQKLEEVYLAQRVIRKVWEHDHHNIGKRPNGYMFKYNQPKLRDNIMTDISRASYSLTGRYSRKKSYGGGSYMNWWNEYTTTEAEALAAIQRAYEAATSNEPSTIYKGYPLRIEN